MENAPTPGDQSALDTTDIENNVLEQLASGESQELVFAAIVSLVESDIKDTIGAIRLAVNGRLRCICAPRLLPELWEAIDRSPAASTLVSFESAIHAGQVIISQDIERDPDWEGCVELAIRHGLRSCWSLAILAAPNKLKVHPREILGTLTVYRTVLGGPTAQDLKSAARAAHLASIAIQMYRREQLLREERNRIAELVNERKRMEEELLHSQKMEAVGRLAGVVAHEFNNLLTVIMGSAELLIEQRSAGHDVNPHLLAIRDASLRAAGLTKQLLSFGRRQEQLPKVVDPNEVVRHVELLLRRVVGKKVQLRFDLGHDIHRIKFDPLQLEQVLFNLVVNSSDSMPEGGVVSISTSNTPSGSPDLKSPEANPAYNVKFQVSDTGCGIEPSLRSQVFKPFFTTKPLGKGTGLGLSVVHGIVTQNGGKIEVESEVGKGTTVQFIVPATDESATLKTSEPPPVAAIEGCETLLVVDGETEIVEITRNFFESLGYKVIAAHDRQSAIAAVSQSGVSLDGIVTDAVLADGNGVELAQYFLQQFPELCIIFMSGHESLQPIDSSQGLPHAFISKPFAPLQLSALVRETLDRRRA